MARGLERRQVKVYVNPEENKRGLHQSIFIISQQYIPGFQIEMQDRFGMLKKERGGLSDLIVILRS